MIWNLFQDCLIATKNTNTGSTPIIQSHPYFWSWDQRPAVHGEDLRSLSISKQDWIGIISNNSTTFLTVVWSSGFASPSLSVMWNNGILAVYNVIAPLSYIFKSHSLPKLRKYLILIQEIFLLQVPVQLSILLFLELLVACQELVFLLYPLLRCQVI